jgi:II/X family phage/plasmid replication protein
LLDTLGFLSPEVSSEAFDLLSQLPDTIELMGVRTSTGEVEYVITKSALVGSYDHRIALKLGAAAAAGLESAGSGLTRRLRVDGSIHKAILGHNIFGGTEDLLASARWLVAALSRTLGVEMPRAEGWEVHRLDWAEVFELASYEACNEYLQGMVGSKYRRRQALTYQGQSIMWPGAVSAFKVYHKGPEFGKHDWARLRNHVRELDVTALQHKADRSVRCEVEVRSKLKNDFGRWPTVDQVPADYLPRLYDTEVGAFLGQSATAMETVRTHKAVSRRLTEVYGSTRGNHLFGVWMQLAALGDAEVRNGRARPTYYRQRKLLKDASVSWLGADVEIVERLSLVPADFSLRRTDPRRVTGEAPEVVKALAPYRQAS